MEFLIIIKTPYGDIPFPTFVTYPCFLNYSITPIVPMPWISGYFTI